MSDYFRVTTKEEVLELLASLPEFLDENGFSEENKQICIANYTRLAEISPTEKELLESEWYADMMERGGVVEPKKYYLKHKFLGEGLDSYLNYNYDRDKLCLMGIIETPNHQTEFTDDAIEEIEALGFDLRNFERIEVEED